MTTVLPKAALRALDVTDAMAPELRQCVHEFGYSIVNRCLDLGVRDPRHIRALVHECWNGARQPHQRSRTLAKNGERKPSNLVAQLDWLLIQSGADIGAETLLRVLRQSGMVIVPTSPSQLMIETSMAEVSGFKEIVAKPEKHRRRLRAAIDAQARSMWPHLYRDEKRGAR